MTEKQKELAKLACGGDDAIKAYTVLDMNEKACVGIAFDPADKAPVKIGGKSFTLQEAAVIAEAIIETIKSREDHHHMEEEAEAVIIWLHDYANFGIIPW
jgi:hypothetical protein